MSERDPHDRNSTNGAAAGSETGQHDEANAGDESGAPPIERTGIANLDFVLGGGLPRGALVLVVGPPGSGKTTLACQMAFAVAAAGRRAAIVTAVSEPSSKLVTHLRSFRFYNDDLVGGAVQFMSLEQFLPSGLHATGDEIVAIARQTRADLIVLDGFRGIRGAEADQQAARQFLYDVGSSLSTLGVTILISSEADPRDPAFFPETTTADTILGLYNGLSGVLQWRALEVVKTRGGAPLLGLHGLAIDTSGVVVYPRLEARVRSPRRAPAPDDHADAEERDERKEPEETGGALHPDDTAEAADTGGTGGAGGTGAGPSRASPAHQEDTKERSAGHPRAGDGDDGEKQESEGEDEHSGRESTDEGDDAGFGIADLDSLLGGGLSRGTSALLIGSLGAGKTFLALHFALAGVAAGERTLFVSFRETRQQLQRKSRGFVLGPALRTALAPGGGLTLQHWDPVELHPDAVAEHLLTALDRTSARRLVVDSIAELEHAIARGDAHRISDYLAALVVALRVRGVTALLLKEHRVTVASELDLSADPLSVLAENVLLLHQLEHRAKLHRVLSVIKMRYSDHDALLHEFAIGQPEGVHLLGTYRSADEMLAAVARLAEGEGGANGEEGGG